MAGLAGHRTLIATAGIIAAAAGFLALLESVTYTTGPATLGVMVTSLVVVALAWQSRRMIAGPRGECIGNLWLAAVSGISFFVVFDLVAGALLLPRLPPKGLADPVIHHRLIPSSVSEYRDPEFSYDQHVNSLGLRGPEVSRAKPAGDYRILVLGDSFALGVGVADDESFAALLPTRLRAVDGRRVQVLNAGVSSYAPILSYLQLTTELGDLGADLVVLALDVSDLLQEHVYRQVASFDSQGLPVSVAASTAPGKPSLRIREWLFEHTYLTRLGLFLQRPAPELLAHTLANDATDRTQQWDAVFASIDALRNAAVRIGADFVMTVHPWGHQVDDQEWIPGRWKFIPRDAEVSDRSLETIRARAATLNINLVDTVPAFREYSGDEQLYFSLDMHFTTTGHRLFADVLANHLATRSDLALQ